METQLDLFYDRCATWELFQLVHIQVKPYFKKVRYYSWEYWQETYNYRRQK